jgi:hypothetical protein
VTFLEALAEIEPLWPLGTTIFPKYQCRFVCGEEEVKQIDIWVNVIPPWKGRAENMKSEMFCDVTWRGVIDKMKIHLLPKGEPDINEAPKEAAQ